MANEAALHLWDDEHWDALSRRYVQLARTTGALGELPLAVSTRAYMLLFAGELASATTLVDEQQAVTAASRSSLAPYSAMALAAFTGRQDDAISLIETTIGDVTERGEGIGIAVAHWANSVLHNGLGSYAKAMEAAQQALRNQDYPELRYPGVSNWAAAELIEAAVRSGTVDVATEAFHWIADMTGASRTNWARGLEAQLRGLIGGTGAEPHFREAIDVLVRTRVRTGLARARLLYGEWLRRRNRRMDAREQLRMAHDLFIAMGMEAFAERARRELIATGEKARKRTVSTSVQLTDRESQIARMARDGLSNPDISMRLFLSPRTVEYHLGNVFAKLGIASRHDLDRALGGRSPRPPRAAGHSEQIR
jgi:ATP/maltotriose-dependent transcriptional regulator MalT